MDEVQKVEACRSADRLEKAPGAAGKVKDLELRVDDDISRTVFLGDLVGPAADREREAAGPLRKLRLGGGRLRRRAASDQREFGQDLRRSFEAPEQPIAAIDGGEQLLVPGDVLRCAEEQQSAGPQREMEDRNHPVLEVGVEVDEEVPARQQVDPREGRVLDQIVRREDAHLPQVLDHAVGVALLHEPPAEPLRRHMFGDRARIAAGPRRAERARVEIGRENLHRRSVVDRLEIFGKQDSDRIGFLAGRAAEHPDPELVGRPLAFE